MSRLQLQLYQDRSHITQGPDAEQIRTALQRLEPGENVWATLSYGNADYLVAMPVSGGFEIEYECGSRENHCRIAGGPISVDEAVLIFQMYAKGDRSWFESGTYDWELMPMHEIDLRRAPRPSIAGDPHQP